MQAGRPFSKLCGNRASGGLLDAVGRDGAVSPQVVYKLDISKLLPVVIAHNEARLLFLDGPRGGEAAFGHQAIQAVTTWRNSQSSRAFLPTGERP